MREGHTDVSVLWLWQNARRRQLVEGTVCLGSGFEVPSLWRRVAQAITAAGKHGELGLVPGMEASNLTPRDDVLQRGHAP